MGNLVAIVGRPNVGKSTLFNRLTKSRQAIVSNEAGTTRDRQYGKCEWNGKEFSVVDTGGWVVNSDDIFEEEIRKQVIIATEEADLVLFLCDINNGVTAWDQDVAQILRRAKLPVLLVANKADDGKDLYDQYEFYKLGLGDPWPISAATGSGTGDLLDKVLELLPVKPKMIWKMEFLALQSLVVQMQASRVLLMLLLVKTVILLLILQVRPVIASIRATISLDLISIW